MYREDRQLRGKALAANTLASFLVAQGRRSLADLSTVWIMDESLLLFLNRQTAIDYWLKDGRLLRRGGGLVLSDKGLNEILEREANESLAKDGKRKAVNVSPVLVSQARAFILGGTPRDSGVAVLSERFELDVPGGDWKAAPASH
ncbi:hypothetical protein D3C78_1409040 [compost metagenome]